MVPRPASIEWDVYRLLLDGLSGDVVARALLWLVNHPAVFVATTLVGNNLANYMLSLSIVLATQRLLPNGHAVMEIVAPTLAAPFFFIYGELLPKHLFFLAPNRFLKASGPFFLICTVIFLPLSLVLWLLGHLIQQLVGESLASVQLRLARRELEQVLDEGRDVGVLRPSQRLLAKTILEGANAPVGDAVIRPFGHRLITDRESWTTIIDRGRRHQISSFAVRSSGRRRLLGYVRLIDVYAAKDNWPQQIRTLLHFGRSDSQLSALIEFHTRHATMAQVLDDHGETLGLVTPDRLSSHPASWEPT